MNTPFVQLFCTPRNFYLFDVNKNEFKTISESSFRYLCATFSGHPTGDISQELSELMQQGYLSQESAVKKVHHAYSEYLDLFLNRKLSKITLQLTQNCNFRCKYCIYSEENNYMQRSHSKLHMSWEIAKKAIDFLWEHSVDSRKVNIGLYGGEPLLEFSLIQEIIKYSESLFWGKKIDFSITTNGTLLSDDIILYFAKHDVSLMISLDGPKEINDQNRVFADGSGTFDAVMARIHRLQTIAPEYAKKLQISMVIDPQNDFDCVNSICLSGEDAHALNIMPAIVDRDYDEEKPAFSEEYKWKIEYQRFLAILAHFNRYSRDKVSPIANLAVVSLLNDRMKFENGGELQTIDVPSGPCIPGQMRLFSDVSGCLFPCERVSETSPAMCIGTLETGFDLEKAKRLLNIGCLTESVCKSCWCFRTCTICAKRADAGADELSAKAKLSFCNETRQLIYEKIRQFLLFKEIPLFYAGQVRKEPEKGDKT